MQQAKKFTPLGIMKTASDIAKHHCTGHICTRSKPKGGVALLKHPGAPPKLHTMIVRACVNACMHACVGACVRARVYVSDVCL